MAEPSKRPPSLGPLWAAWVAAHCVVPDGFQRGSAFYWRGWQATVGFNYGMVRPNIEFDPERPLLRSAFEYKRAQVIGPQKLGKGPFTASTVALEAVGPSLFGGWAEHGDGYACSDNDCGCGFEWEYRPGEPMGMVRPTALIQIVATSEDQTDNIYRPLQAMIRLGPLSENMAVREGFIRLPNDGRIDPVTSAANSKLGAPITFAIMDETGLYTKTNKLIKVAQTIGRNLAGMGGRSIETTNAYDPMDDSWAQRTHESRQPDIYHYYRKPPANLSYRNKRERRKIHAYVYEGTPWVNLDDIESEAAELLESDPAQAERFFGNGLVQGLGAYMPLELLDKTGMPLRKDKSGNRTRVRKQPPDGTAIALGFDGSRSGDWSALRAETREGYRFTPLYGPDKRPTFWNPKEWPGEHIPRGEVKAAVSELFARYRVSRFYIDPRFWETQADEWANEFGEERVTEWPTNQRGRMYEALIRFLTDSKEGLTTHDNEPTYRLHALAARKMGKPGDTYVIGKPADSQKIDILMADILAHEAAADKRAEGWNDDDNRVIVMR